jgi:hypothetical protein
MGNPEKKISPNFTSGSGQKCAKGKTLWNKEGMRYFKNAEKTWTKLFDSEEDMKVLCNGWEELIVSKGKEIAVGDGSKKTFHYIMGSWYDEETPESKEKIGKSEDDDTFGLTMMTKSAQKQKKTKKEVAKPEILQSATRRHALKLPAHV